MKKFNLLILLLSLFCRSSFTQTVTPFNLKDFEGKKIISLFKSTTEFRGSLPSVPALVSNQYHTISRYITIRNSGEKILVDKVISNVKIKMENIVTFEGEEFDTDKKFDRSSMSTMVYGKYDDVINKPLSISYSKKNEIIDTLKDFKGNNVYFGRAWGDEMIPFLQENLIGFFQLSIPQEEWKVGLTWQQTLKRKSGMVTRNENITNVYTVKYIDDKEITLEVKGINIPEQVMIKRSDGYISNNSKTVNTNEKINYTIEQKSDYIGTIKLNPKNNFINKLEISDSFVRKIFEKDKPTTGPETTYNITIENTLEDLK